MLLPLPSLHVRSRRRNFSAALSLTISPINDLSPTYCIPTRFLTTLIYLYSSIYVLARGGGGAACRDVGASMAQPPLRGRTAHQEPPRTRINPDCGKTARRASRAAGDSDRRVRGLPTALGASRRVPGDLAGACGSADNGLASFAIGRQTIAEVFSK